MPCLGCWPQHQCSGWNGTHRLHGGRRNPRVAEELIFLWTNLWAFRLSTYGIHRQITFRLTYSFSYFSSRHFYAFHQYPVIFLCFIVWLWCHPSIPLSHLTNLVTLCFRCVFFRPPPRLCFCSFTCALSSFSLITCSSIKKFKNNKGACLEDRLIGLFLKYRRIQSAYWYLNCTSLQIAPFARTFAT